MRIQEAWAICDCRYFDRTSFWIGSAMIARIDESDGDVLCFPC